MIALSADHVQRAEGRDNVTQHGSFDPLLENARDRDARRTNANAVRRPAAIGDDVEAELAVPALRVRVNLAGRDFGPFHDQLEVLNRGFDRRVKELLLGEG